MPKAGRSVFLPRMNTPHNTSATVKNTKGNLPNRKVPDWTTIPNNALAPLPSLDTYTEPKQLTKSKAPRAMIAHPKRIRPKERDTCSALSFFAGVFDVLRRVVFFCAAKRSSFYSFWEI